MHGEILPMETVRFLERYGGDHGRLMSGTYPLGPGSFSTGYADVRLSGGEESTPMQRVRLTPGALASTSYFETNSDCDLVLGEGVKLEIDGEKVGADGMIHVKEGQKIRFVYKGVRDILMTYPTEMVPKPGDEISVDVVEAIMHTGYKSPAEKTMSSDGCLNPFDLDELDISF